MKYYRSKLCVSGVKTVVCLALIYGALGIANAETFRPAASLEQLLKASDPSDLVQASRLRGDPRRGALVFYRSAAACIHCHASGEGVSSLGPDLAKLNEGMATEKLTDEYLIQSLVFPSREIRKGFETSTILTDDGTTITGIVIEDKATQLILKTASDLEHPVAINQKSVEAKSISKQSMMPEGLMSALRDSGQFFDLAAYVLEVAHGGEKRAMELKPSAEQLAIKEDWLNLDHAGILSKLKTKDFEAGKAIYQGYCIDCHGPDGNRPTLPTARAFGTQKMKFGADPFQMFMTLTRGNGLMGPMSHLTPFERYQVVYYIREQFMKEKNPEFSPVEKTYLEGLPKGKEDGTAIPTVDRNYGPALGSQLERRVRSALTIKLGDISICYDLHSMNQADLWKGGFLDLDDTQHIRNRGEGNPKPTGRSLNGLQGWQWGHDGTLDYSRIGLVPRGPMPTQWFDYHGYYLDGNKVVLSYQIDGREILESVSADSETYTIRHQLEIGPGKALLLAAANGIERESVQSSVNLVSQSQPKGPNGQFITSIATNAESNDGNLGRFTSVAALGQTQGLVWSIDDRQRMVLNIPTNQKSQQFEVVCHRGEGQEAIMAFRKRIDAEQIKYQPNSLKNKTFGSALLWPEKLKTIGTLGLQQGAYVLDTLTIPDSTPWKTWFRTSALDFLSDGRMVVTTYGGDVWIVSGVDETLLNLEWKRFAAGLYEPFGVKVVDDQIYVTCKDRVVRLHDQDQNGEADFYESFSPDTDVSFHFHAFNFDLQTDSQGRFYYAKGGHGADFALPGAIIQISPDGKQQSVYCTGFRVPNGMGIMPDDRMTCSDNQGQWMPASKVNMLRQGGFYGWVPTYEGKGTWSPDGGNINIASVVPPETFDEPMLWMPQEFDNSSGGQLWIDDPRWGPLSGRLLHLSFGKGWMSYMMIQEIDGISQAAIIKLPFDFRTGIMRGRVNPQDGQVYATGLQGWNGGARIGLLDQGIQRLRYTNKPIQMIRDCRVERDGLRIDFNFAVDRETAGRIASYNAKQWNYRWQAEYGSDMYSPTTGMVGADAMEISSAEVSDDGTQVKLYVSNLQPVDQVHLILKIKSQDDTRFEEEVYWTIHRIPK